MLLDEFGEGKLGHDMSAVTTVGETVAVESRLDDVIVALRLDAAGRRLVAIEWLPGETLAAREIPLAAPVMNHPEAVSAGGDLVLLTDGEQRLELIDRRDGSVTVLPRTPSPAVLTPDGRALIAVTDEGLLALTLARYGENPLTLQSVRPMLVRFLDNPQSVVVVPSRFADAFSLAIGCYGSLALVTVRSFKPGPADASIQVVDMGVLPYDPISVQRPVPLVNDRFSRLFVTDWGRAGLAAVQLGSGEVIRASLEDRNYGAIGPVLPDLYGERCLFMTRDKTIWRWEPGKPPEAMPHLTRMPLLWHENLVLVSDERGTLREQPLAPQ